MAFMALLLLASPASAADWPCVQRKVPEISLVSFWTGKPLDGVKDSWKSDQQVLDMVDRLAARRTPAAEAHALLDQFAENAKEPQLLGIVQGLFERLNAERADVLAGIERYGAKQKAMADAIRKREAEVAKARADDADNYEELFDQLTWELRVFDERQKALTYVCEVPVLIEQRLFDMAKYVGKKIK